MRIDFQRIQDSVAGQVIGWILINALRAAIVLTPVGVWLFDMDARQNARLERIEQCMQVIAAKTPMTWSADCSTFFGADITPSVITEAK